MLGVPFCPAVAAGRDTWRRHVAQSAVVRYAVAVVAVAVMVVLGLWLRPIVNVQSNSGSWISIKALIREDAHSDHALHDGHDSALATVVSSSLVRAALM